VNGPLTGIRVLEIGHMLAGPYCGLLLADLGAEVIKIEPPEGDIARRVSPHFIGQHNDYFASLNRNKKSVTIDLASAQGLDQFRRLVRTAQALVTNLRPGAIEKLGLTYDQLQNINPNIVCVALTGFGLSSPFADRPAYDYIVQAMTGVMLLTGAPDGPPVKTGYSSVDNSAGMMAAFALTAKLAGKKGGQIDIAMYDVMLSQLNYIASAWLNGDVKAVRFADSAHPYVVPAQIFRTLDGWLALFITHDDFWKKFCTEAGKPEWLTDGRFATMEARRANRELVVPAIAKVIACDSAESWAARLVPLGVVAAAVTTMETALASEHVAARDMIVSMETPWGVIRGIGNPVKASGDTAGYAPPPLLGEHNAELLGNPL
jgi:crotonobetainyl-CoA:carnitine CoA-transferase CaiB-like acyl-CoA transferase